MEYKITYRGNCGQIHQSHEEWRNCKACHYGIIEEPAQTKVDSVGMIYDVKSDYALQNAIALIINDECRKTVHAPMVCAQEILNKVYDANTELGKSIWNAAIEAAAVELEEYELNDRAEIVRKLKK